MPGGFGMSENPSRRHRRFSEQTGGSPGPQRQARSMSELGVYLMQNLAEEFGQFRPGPSREELNHMLNLPQ